MKKIIFRINLQRLRNEEWFTFFLELRKIIQKTTSEKLGIESLFTEFSGLLDTSEVLLEQIKKSELTDVIVKLDGVRDDAFRGLKAEWKAALFNRNVEKRSAANALDIVFNYYGNPTIKSYKEETGLIVNFVSELRGKYAPYIQTLGLTEMVTDLERANEEFETIVLQRNEEAAEKPDTKFVEIRHETNRCYMDIVERVEAKVLLNGMNEAMEYFISNLNKNITRFKS